MEKFKINDKQINVGLLVVDLVLDLVMVGGSARISGVASPLVIRL